MTEGVFPKADGDILYASEVNGFVNQPLAVPQALAKMAYVQYEIATHLTNYVQTKFRNKCFADTITSSSGYWSSINAGSSTSYYSGIYYAPTPPTSVTANIDSDNFTGSDNADWNARWTKTIAGTGGTFCGSWIKTNTGYMWARLGGVVTQTTATARNIQTYGIYRWSFDIVSTSLTEDYIKFGLCYSAGTEVFAVQSGSTPGIYVNGTIVNKFDGTAHYFPSTVNVKIFAQYVSASEMNVIMYYGTTPVFVGNIPISSTSFKFFFKLYRADDSYLELYVDNYLEDDMAAFANGVIETNNISPDETTNISQVYLGLDLDPVGIQTGITWDASSNSGANYVSGVAINSCANITANQGTQLKIKIHLPDFKNIIRGYGVVWK